MSKCIYAKSLFLVAGLPGLLQAQPVFIDAGAEAGLDFVHFNGMSGQYFFVEMTGQGGALFDYDNDGDLDLYLVQGSMLGPGKTLDDALFPPRDRPPRDRLYRNDLQIDPDGSRSLRFVDVTEASGIRLEGYGMGVAAADYDNDGWVDLYVTHYGGNRLLRNLGDGRFADVTEASGTGDDAWGTSASFVDFDRDGRLDLYLANYVDYSVAENKVCYGKSSRRDYCGPSGFLPVHDRLFRNLGEGRFAEVSDRLLKGYRPGPGLGVLGADLNGDAWPDLYVANDGAANQFWLNQEGRGFVDDALFSGTAVNREGKAEASMGLDAGDFDNDGDLDLFITHLMGETNTLYVNNGQGLFEDRTVQYGLAAGSFPYTAFGTAWLDYDNDGWLDLLVLNGAVQVVEALARAGDRYPLDQPDQLFRNQQGKGFREVDYATDSPLRRPAVSRGAAFGDIDNDGDTDLVAFDNNGPVRLLLNQIGQDRPWLGLRLLDAEGRFDRLGTRVELLRNDGPNLWRRSSSDGSYCAANDPRVLIGLPEPAAQASVRIHWPDGAVEERELALDGTYHQIRQGERQQHAD